MNDEKIVTLDNAILMLNTVETKGEKNLNALLAGIQQIRKVSKALKEENADEKRNND